MTGFGKGEMGLEGKSVSVELKSVNHRFLDLYLRIPATLNFAEDYVRKALQNAFSRGHIECTVSFVKEGALSKKFVVDEAAAMNYLDLAASVANEYGIVNDLGVKDLFRLPSVLVEEKIEDNEEELQLLLSVALESAISSLKEMRGREGENLKKTLSSHLDVVAELTEAAKMRAPKVVDDYREKLSKRVKDYLSDVELDEARLLNEVAFYSDKVNVDEEINRLFSHVDQFGELLESAPAGKKMDFLLQEMNREVNTLGSKANDAELLNLVVSLKNELEKMREQVQNVE
ncbi:MAG: YicC family protein [Clostridia bacterium]|nr:YicC family protein [Clostridia bacterium]